MAKQRITVSIDADVVASARASIGSGSLSAWVEGAVVERLTQQRRLHAGRAAVAAYEAEHGVITDAEMDDAERSVSRNTTAVRRPPSDGVA